jgi:hypothetical protein
MEAVYRIVVGVPYGKKAFGRLRTDGRIILKWILEVYEDYTYDS